MGLLHIDAPGILCDIIDMVIDGIVDRAGRIHGNAIPLSLLAPRVVVDPKIDHIFINHAENTAEKRPRILVAHARITVDIDAIRGVDGSAEGQVQQLPSLPNQNSAWRGCSA